jgi:hypothetical protein
MNERTDHNLNGGGGGGRRGNGGGATVASVLGVDGSFGNHGRGRGRNMGSGKSARVDRDGARSDTGGASGGRTGGNVPPYRDMDNRSGVYTGRGKRFVAGFMRVFPWFGARLDICEAEKGAWMTQHAPFVRAILLGALIWIGLHWALGEWMASIEARLWLYEIMQGQMK